MVDYVFLVLMITLVLLEMFVLNSSSNLKLLVRRNSSAVLWISAWMFVLALALLPSLEVVLWVLAFVFVPADLAIETKVQNA